MKTVLRYSVDIDASCKEQEFTVTRLPCFITGKPVAIVTGMGLSMSYMDNGELAVTFIETLLGTVNCVPMSIRLICNECRCPLVLRSMYMSCNCTR